MGPKQTEALTRFCKWDDEQLRIGLEIISKYESFKTKDTDEVNLRKKTSLLKDGKKFRMTVDLFSKFSKVPKEDLTTKRNEILGGNLRKIMFSKCCLTRFLQCQISCCVKRRKFIEEKKICRSSERK